MFYGKYINQNEYLAIRMEAMNLSKLGVLGCNHLLQILMYIIFLQNIIQ